MPQPGLAEHVEMDRILRAVLHAADPGAALVRSWPVNTEERSRMQGCVLVAAGKASVAMACAAVERCGLKPALGIVVGPPGSRWPPPASLIGIGVRLMEADHPLPSQRNLLAAQAVLDAARMASSRKIALVCLLSGGASAHLTIPERGITLSDVRVVTETMLRAGATIHELNTVRRHCERLKGGGMARAAAPSPVWSFVLSDVVGEPPPLETIASGPTAPDPTTYADALAALEARGAAEIAPALTAHLKEGVRGKRPETVKPGDELLARVRNIVIGSNTLAVVAASEEARSIGLRVVEARLGVEGEARVVGRAFAERLIAARREVGGTVCIIWGGETTVTVRGQGSGGRNQEAAAGAALRIAGEEGVCIACLGTDGVDGVAPQGQPGAAGAVVTGRTVESGRASGVDLERALELNDTYPALKGLGAQIVTGPTGTNVNDVMIGVAGPAGV